tara:strand:- start:137 stop:1120 length:984 start_codon:yes stop_codon:yes gene_type:complete
MILKSYEIKKINTNKSKIILLYGKNDAQKDEAINSISNNTDYFSYDQNQIIENPENFFDEIYTKSLFGNNKIIIIKRVTDKILNTIQNINLEKVQDTIILLIADILDKRSKLRLKFEKDKDLVCIAFYPDSRQTLMGFASNFLRKINVSVSSSLINTIIEKTNEDKGALLNELKKIDLYTKNNKKIDEGKIYKLINLNENHSFNDLVDNCLVKNKKKTIRILGDNNFVNEDCVLIMRIFLNKSKLVLKLVKEYEINHNIDKTISLAKPPIFWKDKEMVKNQILNWQAQDLNNLIYEINELELLIKKNINNSINLMTNFIFEKLSTNN